MGGWWSCGGGGHVGGWWSCGGGGHVGGWVDEERLDE